MSLGPSGPHGDNCPCWECDPEGVLNTSRAPASEVFRKLKVQAERKLRPTRILAATTRPPSLDQPTRPSPLQRPYRQWTLPELRYLLACRKKGDRTADLAASVGVTESCLRQAWRKHLGEGSEGVYVREHSQAERDHFVWARRQEGLTFREIAERLGETWEGRRTFSRLRMGCRRYAERLKLETPKGRADR